MPGLVAISHTSEKFRSIERVLNLTRRRRPAARATANTALTLAGVPEPVEAGRRS
jgi:hypothetical protein